MKHLSSNRKLLLVLVSLFHIEQHLFASRTAGQIGNISCNVIRIRLGSEVSILTRLAKDASNIFGSFDPSKLDKACTGSL